MALPKVKIPIRSLCDSGYRPSDFQEAIIGYAYYYSWNDVINAAKTQNRNVDQFVTAFLASGFYVKRPKRDVLIWFAAINGAFWLYACSKGQKAKPHWMNQLPGFQEQGQDFIRENAMPFAYWDQANFYRIYVIDAADQRKGCCVCDFGSLIRLNTVSASREDYERIRNNPAECADYSAVPEVADQIVTWNGSKLVVTHAILEVV